ncbi:MAG: pilus assembly protein TadG-related protein [Myxococcota bacterium]|nr:pilus assembly protein TadG-related protein [Myxococcota bacterium]
MRARRGQSLVLAAVACLGLALGVLATVQMGRAVHQRIHVQNVADSAAYSVAAAQARAYNFWAFSNRAQITHYNAMMGLQAYASYLQFMPYALASLSDTVYEASSVTAGFSCCFLIHGWGCGCRITLSGPRDLIPSLCRIALSARDAMRNQRQLFERMHDVAATLDPLLANLRRTLEVANRTLVPAANAAMFQSAQDYIQQGRRRLVREMDDRVNAEPVAQGIDFLLDRMNQTAFAATVEPTAMALAPRANNGEASRRIMAELANASRYDELVTNRRARGLFLGLQSSLLIGGETAGQTKLISQGRISNNASHPVPEITGNAFDESIAPVGDYLASEDTFRYGVPTWNFLMGEFRSTGDFGSYVVAGPGDRKLKKWDPNPSWQTICWGRLYGISARRGNNYDADESGPSFDGIAPYMRFAARATAEQDFGQPSVYTFANKAARHIDRDGRSGPALDFRLDTADRQNVRFNSRIGAEGGLLGQLTGVNAVARALTYYHRPGNWAEHPNFFNPFWRAKLAPIGQRFLGNPLSGLLGGQIGTFMSNNFMTH